MAPNVTPTPAGPVAPVLLESEPGRFRCSVWQNVTFLLWSDVATARAIERVQRVTKRMIERYPQGHSNVSFVLNGVGPPLEEAREPMARAFNGRVSMLKCVTIITEGDGFWASALRSSVINIGLSAGSQLQMRLHRSMEEAARWLPGPHHERTNVLLGEQELATALRTFRDQASAPGRFP
jgi:hypothetical protein